VNQFAIVHHIQVVVTLANLDGMFSRAPPTTHTADICMIDLKPRQISALFTLSAVRLHTVNT
jgi:hypothetical protein